MTNTLFRDPQLTKQVKVRSSAARYVKCGNKLEDLRNDRHNRIGRPMDPIAERLRYEGKGAPGDERCEMIDVVVGVTLMIDWQHGLGAFMGSFITKSRELSTISSCFRVLIRECWYLVP